MVEIYRTFTLSLFYLTVITLAIGCSLEENVDRVGSGPSDLSYSISSAVYTRTVAISDNLPTVTGEVLSYSVSPALPAGLTLNTTTGVISGIPTETVTDGVYTVSASNNDGVTTTELTITVESYLAFSNGQPASFALGQTNMTSAAMATTRSGMNGPYSNVGVYNDHVYVATTSRRVVNYALPVAANGANAVNVVGQDDFTSTLFGTTANRYDYPGSPSFDGDKMFVADWDNNRVMIYNTVPTSPGAAADVVVGQNGFGAPIATCDSTHYNGSMEGVSAADGKLVVADKLHHRVLIYNSIPSAHGAAADLVLGQTNLTSCAANNGGLGASSLSRPPAVIWTDGSRILVADLANNRVLIWNSWPTVNGQAADLVLGQPDFTTNTGGVTEYKMDSPWGISSNGTQIFVADSTNNRVLGWNVWPTANGQAADLVLGQADFTSSAFGTTATTMFTPSGIGVSETQLFVSDWGNNRVLVFTSQ